MNNVTGNIILQEKDHPTKTESTISVDLNLEELPWFLFSKKKVPEIRYESAVQTPEGQAQITWIVRGGPLGLPAAFEQDVYVALCKLYSEQGFPSDGRTWFSLYRLGKILNMRLRGQQYKHLEKAVQTLGQVYFESHGAYYSKEAECRIKGGFPLFTKWNIRKVRRGSLTAERAYVQFNQAIVGNLRSFYVKEIDLDLYFSLEEGEAGEGYSRSAVAKKLYRLLNRRKMDALVLEIDLMNLARMIPLFQKYPSQLRRVIDPANALLKSRGFLKEVVVERTGKGRFQYTYEMATARAKRLDERDAYLLEELMEILKDAHSLPFYRQVVQQIPHHLIRRCLGEVRVSSQMGEIRKSPGAMFVDLLRRVCSDLRLEFPWGKNTARMASPSECAPSQA